MKQEQLPFVREIMRNVLVNSINYDTPVISGKILAPWSFYSQFENLSYYDVTKNMPDFMVARGLNKYTLIENHFFNQFLENISDYFIDESYSKKEVLEDIIAGFGGFSRRELQSTNQFDVLTKFTGKSMEALSYLPQDFSYLTTPFKDVSVTKPQKLSKKEIEEYGFNKKNELEILGIDISKLKKITMRVAPVIPGLKTSEANFYFYFGSAREILKNSSDLVFDYKVKYDSATGIGEIIGYYEEKKKSFLPQRTKFLKYLFPKIWKNKYKAKKIISNLEKKINFANELINEKNNVVFNRDLSTGNHVNGMTLISMVMQYILAAEDTQKRDCILGGQLHDLGKNWRSDRVLKKIGKFSPLERKDMDAHGPDGTLMLSQSNLGEYILNISRDNVMAMTMLHHMPQNGNNYYGIDTNPEEIPLFGRISLVADIFHGLLEQRVYKNSIPIDDVLENLKKWFPQDFFDPIVLEVLNDYLVPFFKKELKNDIFTAEDLNKILQSKFNGNIGFVNAMRSLSNGNLTQKEQLDLFCDSQKSRKRLLELRSLAQKMPQKAQPSKVTLDWAKKFYTGIIPEMRYLDKLGHVIENSRIYDRAPSSLQQFIDDNRYKRNTPNLGELSKEDLKFLEELSFKEDPLIEQTKKRLIKEGSTLKLEEIIEINTFN